VGSDWAPPGEAAGAAPLTVPLPQRAGVLVVLPHEEARGDAGHAEPLTGLAEDLVRARHAAEAEARLRREHTARRRHAEQLEAMVEIAARLAIETDELGLCRRAVELARDRLGFARVAIWLLEAEGAGARGTFAADADGVTHDETGRHLPVTDTTALGRVLGGVSPLETTDPRTGREASDAWHAVVPIEHRDGRVLGALTATAAARQVPAPDYLVQSLRLYAALLGEAIEAVRNDQALRESERNFRDLYRNAPVGLGRVRLSDRALLDCNQRLLEMLGYASLEELRRHGAEHRVFLDADARTEFLARLLETGEVTGFEARLRRRDGSELWARLGARLYPAEDYAQAIVEDITLQRALQEELRQSATMESLGKLAGGVAHEFNNLLTGVMAYAQIAADRAPPDGPLGRSLAEIRRLADRAAELTRQLLAFSRRQSLRRRPLALNDLVSGALEVLQRIVGEDIEVRFAPGEGLGVVHADPYQLEQALVDLAAHAREAMPSGGRLLVETANAELDAAYAETHPDVRPGRYVMLAVSDTGPGMDRRTAARIFEPFFSPDPSGKGAGLALATVYGIVTQHGGHIQVYSEPGHGTSFKLYLPRVDARAEPLPPAVEAGPRAASATLLLVEDEQTVREVVQHVLESEGYTVLVASSAERAEALFEEHLDRVDLLLTDVVMPGRNGLDLFASLRARRPSLRVLYMSGYTDGAVLQQEGLDGNVPFLQKPFTPDRLLRKVREVLAGEGPAEG